MDKFDKSVFEIMKSSFNMFQKALENNEKEKILCSLKILGYGRKYFFETRQIRGKNEMDREDAIDYLEEKGIVTEPYSPRKERKFSENEEIEIKTVMKQGKIYGDPLVILDE